LRDGSYGFGPFHGGQNYASFPSGHTAVTCSVISGVTVVLPEGPALRTAVCVQSPSDLSAPIIA